MRKLTVPVTEGGYFSAKTPFSTHILFWLPFLRYWADFAEIEVCCAGNLEFYDETLYDTIMGLKKKLWGQKIDPKSIFDQFRKKRSKIGQNSKFRKVTHNDLSFGPKDPPTVVV